MNNRAGHGIAIFIEKNDLMLVANLCIDLLLID